MRKDIIEWQRNSELKKIFNTKRRIKSKGGKSTLGEMYSSNSISDATYESPNGLQGEEWKIAMMEATRGYSWSMCSIIPKEDVAKKIDYLSLLNELE